MSVIFLTYLEKLINLGFAKKDVVKKVDDSVVWGKAMLLCEDGGYLLIVSDSRNARPKGERLMLGNGVPASMEDHERRCMACRGTRKDYGVPRTVQDCLEWNINNIIRDEKIRQVTDGQNILQLAFSLHGLKY